MFKKFATLLIGGILGFSFAHAQDFEYLFSNPLHDTTAGVTPYSGSGLHDFVEVRQFIKNTSSTAYSVSWRSLSTDTTQNPTGWILTGICDNINCRGEYGPWYYGATEQSADIQPDATSLMLIHVYVPTTSIDTVGIYKVEIKSPNQTDTAVYIINKDHTLGISAIQLKDNRVSIYPNPLPAGQKMNLYIDKNLHVENAEVFNIIGQKLMSLPLAKGKEVQSFNVNNLTAGLYLIKIVNESGNVVTSRKFVKQ